MGSGAVRGARSMMGVRGAKESGASRFRRIRGLRESRGSEAANRVRGDEICSEDARGVLRRWRGGRQSHQGSWGQGCKRSRAPRVRVVRGINTHLEEG